MAVDFSLRGRHAWVCGASAGIGRAIAEAFAEQGASLTLTARRADRLAALRDGLLARGAPAAHVVPADLDDREALARVAAAHVRQVGVVHILVNNAGGPAAGPILAAEPEAFSAAFARHVLAAHILVRLLLPAMSAAGYGRILNVISTSVREPIPNLGVSNTVRGAMASWAKSLSKELPPGVTINNLLPGYTDTERLNELRAAVAKRRGISEDAVLAEWLAQVPEGRLGRPEEIAAAAVFLASPAGSFVRGASLAIDGGRLASL